MSAAPVIGAKVTTTLTGEIIAIDNERGFITLKGNTKGADHIPWVFEVHWATEFDKVES